MKTALLVKRIEDSLQEDRREGLQHGEVVAHELAVRRCGWIASQVEPRLASDSRWACFGEDGGGVTFTIRSLHVDRRVDFRIAANGRHVTVIAIDKYTRATVQRLPVDDCDRIIDLTKWVNGETDELPWQRAGG